MDGFSDRYLNDDGDGDKLGKDERGKDPFYANSQTPWRCEITRGTNILEESSSSRRVPGWVPQLTSKSREAYWPGSELSASATRSRCSALATKHW